MFSIIRKVKSTPVFKSQTPHDLPSITPFDQKVEELQKLIDDMLIEYQFMDTPIKTPSKPKRPPSETPTIDQILHTLLS
jgi:hypothetical protein